MQETRRARLSSVILAELSRLISRELKDPRVPPVTLTRVDVTEDGSQATVWLTLLGAGILQREMDEARRIQQDEEEAERMEDCLEGLKSSAGYLRRALAKALTVRHIPHLIFKPDRGIENAARVHALLKEIEGEKRSAEE